MKVLFFDPNINAEHNIIQALQKEGIAVLLPGDLEEALHMLHMHGESIDLAVIHREILGKKGKEGGLEWIREAKNNPIFSHLPIILSSQEWSDGQCSTHQSTSEGVNAYLRTPYSEKELLDLIQAVFGDAFQSTNHQQNSQVNAESSDLGNSLSSPSPVLEDASALFLKSEVSHLDLNIQLEAPIEASEKASLLSGTGEVGIQQIPHLENFQIQSGDAKDQLLSPIEIQNEIPPIPELQSSIDLPVLDQNQEIEQEMPYLYDSLKDKKEIKEVQEIHKNNKIDYDAPLGNAIIPGGLTETPDIETFKKYLYLREQDVTVLSHQLKTSQNEVQQLALLLKEEKGKSAELTHLANEQKKRIENFDKEKEFELKNIQKEINELQFQVKAKTDKSKLLESQVKEASLQMEQLKERVRMDLRKIRVNEKELENRIEIMKNDSEVLIAARETKIIELKRKLDLLEFNMDLLQDQNSKEKELSSQLKDRLLKASQVVRVVGGLLDSEKEAELKEHLNVESNEILSESIKSKAS